MTCSHVAGPPHACSYPRHRLKAMVEASSTCGGGDLVTSRGGSGARDGREGVDVVLWDMAVGRAWPPEGARNVCTRDELRFPRHLDPRRHEVQCLRTTLTRGGPGASFSIVALLPSVGTKKAKPYETPEKGAGGLSLGPPTLLGQSWSIQVRSNGLFTASSSLRRCPNQARSTCGTVRIRSA
jgi:hypothetical protein